MQYRTRGKKATLEKLKQLINEDYSNDEITVRINYAEKEGKQIKVITK